MTHFNLLNRMLQGCSAFIQTMAGDRAARNDAKRVNNHVLPLTCPLLASSSRLTCPLQLRRIALILCVLVLSVGQMWGETATSAVAGTYSVVYSSSPIGGEKKFKEIATNAVYLYRNSSWSYSNNNGVKATSGNNSGIVFYISSPMSLSATIYQNATTAETVTVYVKSVSSTFFQELVDGSDNNTTASAHPTLGDVGSFTITGSTTKQTYTDSYASALSAGYYYVYATSSASSVNTYLQSITLATSVASSWKLKGDFDSWGDGYAMSGSGTVSVTRTLPANSRYEFKFHDGTSYYGNTGAIVHSISGWEYETGKDNGILYTGPAGDYTFSINTSTHVASITYPDVDHPNSNYIYIKKGAGWSDARLYNWEEGSSSKMSDWGGSPVLATTTICGTEYWYGAAYWNKLKFRDGESNQSNELSFDKDATGGGGGKYLDETTHADAWSNFDLYTISFDAGDGTGTMSAIEGLCPGDDPVLPANTFTRTGYTFNGWKTDVAITANSAAVAANGAVAAGATINDIATDITLTAQWSCIDFTPGRGGTADGTYTVGEDGGALTCSVAAAGSYTYQWKQYTSGQAEGDAVDAVGSGATTTSFTPHPTSAGTYYYFCAVTNECGTTKNCATSGTFVFNAAATLYTVTYNVNGAGSVTPASATQASADAAVTLPTPTWSGYTFEGWYNNGTKIGNGGASYTPTADITLYAHWTDNISGKVFSFIDNNYGDKFKGFDGETLVSGNATGKNKTYTNGTTGVQFVVEDGAWDGKSNAIASLAKLVNGTTSMSVVVPTGKKATVKISYGAYNTGNKLTVNSTDQTAPSTALTDGMTNAQVFAALKEITLNNQTGTLTLGSSTGNIYIGRVSATITSYTVTHTLSNVSKTSGETSAAANTAYTAVYSATSGYELPDAISVTIGGVAQTAGTGYTWTKATGTVTIPAAYVTGDIVITVTGVEESGDSGDCIEWAGTPSSLTDGAMTVSTNLQLSVSGASIASENVWSGSGNKTLFKIDGADRYVQGHFVDDSEISAVTVSAATNQDDAKKYAIVFCANSSFSSGVTVQTHTAPSASSTRNDANLIHEFTAPAGTKYFRIYRKYVLSETQYGDNRTIRVYGVEVCPAACSNPVIDESATKASFAGGSWAQNSGHTITITATGASSYEWYRNTSANDAGATKLSETSNALDITADVATGTYFYKAVAKSGACSSSTEWGWCGAMTITAPTTYTVTYNGSSADGGNVPVDGNSYTSGSTVTVLGNTGSLTRSIEGDAATFYGWNTNSNMYGGTHYNAGETFSMPSSDVTLYAVWGYTITWDLNDGDWVGYTAPTYYIYGQGLTLPAAAKISKSGYTFDHWELAYDNSTITAIADDATGNVTLNAIWTENTGNKVTYNGNGNTSGSVPTDDTDYAAGEIVTVKGNTGDLAKTGYVFRGWNTADDYTGTFYPADYKFAMPAGAVTLYAVWGTGQVCYTITDFETNNYNRSSNSNKPDGLSKYLYGYQTTIDTDHALTLSSDNSNTKGQNEGVELRLDNRATLRIYANNVTNAAPAEFENITQISFKAKLYNSSGSERTTPYTIKVGGTTVGSGNIVGQATDGYFDITTGTLATPKNGYVAITLGGSGSNQNLYIDDIEICTGSGSSGYTVTFDNNGEGTYSKTITNVPSGSKIGVPIPAPTADGNTFGGWYKEEGCTNAWNFATETVTADKTLYAKWTNCLPTITTQPVGNTYTRGDAAGAMTIVASGAVTGYQWFSNDENNATTGTPIDGQTTGGYKPTTDVVGTTYYYCVVSNDCGSVASNVVAIVVNDDRLTPCAAWTIAEPTHGGQGFSFSVAAKKSDCSEAWDGTLTEGMLTVSEGVILGAITVDNDDDAKTISGTYGVSGTAESPVTFYLSLPRTDTHSAALLSQTQDFTTCEGGAEEFYWSANVSSPLTANTAAKLVSKTTDTEIELSGSTSANSSTRTTDTATGIVDGTTYSFLSSDPHHTYIKMGSGNTFHFTTTATATISIQFSTPSNENSGIEIRQSSSSGTVVASKMITSKAGQFQTLTASSVAAGTYYVVAVNKEMNIGEILVVQGSGSAGDITPTLAWSNSDAIAGTVVKNEDAADFAVTANRSDANARASLGTISYSSSNTSVATVNAATGQVTIADNIDFGSETSKTTTITATLAASGCYKRAQISYVLRVNKDVCTEAAGTVRIKTDNGCAGIELTVTGFETGATGFQWYKNGDIITGATDQDYTATVSGTYSVVTTKTCDVTSSNSVKVTIETATATKIVDEWYVKNGRRTPDIALVQTTNATGFTVKSGSTVIWNSDGTVATGFGGCGFYLGTDGIIYLKGQQDNGTVPDGLTAGDETITITASACWAASGLDIVIHKQASTLKPSIAFVVDGGVGKAVDNVSDTKTSNRALWTYLTSAFDLTGCNIYWTTDEKALRQYYSQYDAILITDDPNTQQYPDGKDEKISATKGYVNAMGTLIDVRPMLTMEAYVSRLDNWDCVKGKPVSPSPRDYVLKLQCKEHAIYKNLVENGTTVRQEEIDGIDHWYVTMVDESNKTYADTDDETDATGTPALQGFDGKVNAGMLGIGTIANETLQGGIERQAEPAARMMVLGINNKAMAALTDPGKKVIMNALTYLLHTDMETLEDCSNYFHGQEGTSTDWFTAANWSAGKVPDPTVRAVILAPCEIAGATPARASSVDIAVGGRTGRYKSGASDCEGHLTIAATGALVVSEGVRRIEDAPNFGVDSRIPTETSDLYIASTSSNGNGTLIFDNPDGNTQATVGYYSMATTDENETWNWQYMAVPFNDNSSAYRNFYDSYLYRWAENCSGWEVVPNRGAVYPWVGYTITQVGAKTYYMDGTLVETGEQTFTVPAGADLVLGNSWTAPLQIKQFEDDDFDGLVKKVYLFNTGYDYDKNGTQYEDGATHYEAGTYVVVPIHSSPYTGDSLISSLQAFTVTSESGEGTLTLDYERHVRPARSTDKVNAGPMHAPRRAAAREDKPTVLKIWASGQRFDDRLVVLEREDFSTGSDDGWDGEKVLMGEMSPTVYSVMENGYESVTATNDYEGTLIGFKAGEDNEYTFRFEYDDMAEPLFLLDMDERMYVRILTGTTYTFTCADKGEHNRFLLTRKAPGIPTGCEPIDGGGGPKAMKFIKDNKLYILLNGVLYDATGKVVE